MISFFQSGNLSLFPSVSLSVMSRIATEMLHRSCSENVCTYSGSAGHEIVAFHTLPLRILSWVGQRVTQPVPRGNAIPDNASRTEDLPEDWSPMTAICGRGRYWPTPMVRSSSTRSIMGPVRALSIVAMFCAEDMF